MVPKRLEDDFNVVESGINCILIGLQDRAYKAGVVDGARGDGSDEALRAKYDEQRLAWRKACRFIYDVLQDGGSRGRPMDLIDKPTWHTIIKLIGEAEELEAAE